RLGNAGGAAGLEDEHRPAGERLRNPALHGTAAQCVVVELTEARQVGEARDLAPGIPRCLFRELEPERTTARGIEMPVDDLAPPGVELLARCRRGRHGTRWRCVHDRVV